MPPKNESTTTKKTSLLKEKSTYRFLMLGHLKVWLLKFNNTLKRTLPSNGHQ